MIIQNNSHDFVYKPSDDLVMVVHCVFQRMCPVLYATVFLSGDVARIERAHWIQTFRAKHMTGEPWHSMLKCAEAGSYKLLKKHILSLQLAGVREKLS